MRGSSSDARMKYLSLALFAQKIIDALIEYVDEGSTEKLDACAPEAITSLKAVLSSQPTASRTRAIRYYEQVRTINEIEPDKNEWRHVIQMLERLLEAGRVPRAQKVRNAKEAIRFFHKIENQALLNCNRPDKPLPKGLHSLFASR